MMVDRIAALVVLCGFAGTTIMALTAMAHASRARRVKHEIEEMFAETRRERRGELEGELRELLKKREDEEMRLAQIRAEITALDAERARLKALIATLEEKTALAPSRRGRGPAKN